MPAPQHLRVFISSPSDVADERNLARGLLERLPLDPLLSNKVTLDPVSWDHPTAPTPMLANLTPQEAVNDYCRPSECDIVIVVLWSRLGTHLDLSKFQKPNGEPYLSGTEYEYEDASNSPRQPPPVVLVYRRMEEPTIGMRDPDFEEKREQYHKVDTFFAQFKNPDGSYRGGFTPYETSEEFEGRLEKDLKTILRKRLEAAPSPSPDVDVVPVWKGSPYPGLRPFHVTEWAIFCGLGRETDALIARLRDPNHRFLMVVGAPLEAESRLSSGPVCCHGSSKAPLRAADTGAC